MRSIIFGWFSLPIGTATIGDYLAATVVNDILVELSHTVEVWAPALGGTDLVWVAEPRGVYDLAVWVCGPLSGGKPSSLISRLNANRFVAVGVSDVGNTELHRQFEAILWRDEASSRSLDLAVLATLPGRPLIGSLLAGTQHEYLQDDSIEVGRMLDAWLETRGLPRLDIDTKLPKNEYRVREPEAILRQIASVDLLFTTRLHGVVLATRLGTPVVAVDQIPGGAKVTAQCALLGIPCVTASDLTDAHLDEALNRATNYRNLGSRAAPSTASTDHEWWREQLVSWIGKYA